MGTRADFYIGRGEKAEWLGSIAWDGYPYKAPDNIAGVPQDVLGAVDEPSFREAVKKCLEQELRHGTKPEQGWPWPWPTSHITDYAYAFDGGKVWIYGFGELLELPTTDRRDEYKDDEDEGDKNPDRQMVVFPDMSEISNCVPPNNPRSGIFTINQNFGIPEEWRKIAADPELTQHYGFASAVKTIIDILSR